MNVITHDLQFWQAFSHSAQAFVLSTFYIIHFNAMQKFAEVFYANAIEIVNRLYLKITYICFETKKISLDDEFDKGVNF